MSRFLVFAAAFSRVLASAWIGLMITAILHTRVPLPHAGDIWLATTVAVWALTARRAEGDGT